MPTYDTIVIGMGASGTAAASTLARAGRRVLALEAQDRIGGRVHTVPFGDGVVELGAEWIHGTESSPVYELGVRNNISLLPQELSFKVHFSDGSSDKEALVTDLTEYLLEVQENLPDEPQPLGQYLTKKVLERIDAKYPQLRNESGFVESFLEFSELLVCNYESCNSWHDVTTRSQFRELAGHQHVSWHKHGYHTLFHLLLNTYNKGPGYPTLDMKLSTEVTQIQWPQQPHHDVVVTVKDGTSYSANNAIVTLSVGVLKERYTALFSPPLPREKVEAIESLRIGLLDKVILYFAEPWWSPGEFFHWCWSEGDRKAVGEEDKWLTKITMFSNPMSTPHALTVWFSGDRAKLVETLPDHVVKTKVMGVIRKFMAANTTIPDPVHMIRSSWHSNPLTRGSYTYDDVRLAARAGGGSRARADLARPLHDAAGAPRLLFAGEATHHMHFSTVHGAVETGYREANRLLPASKM